MGLDGVELVMAWEKEFGIDIPDHAAAVMYTPRHAADWIAGRLPRRRSRGCRTQRAFNRIRAALRDELGIRREAVRPDARLEDVLAGARPREQWRAAQQRIGGGWAPGRVDWAGDVLSSLLCEPRLPRYRGTRRVRTLADAARNVAAYDADLRPAPGEAWTREEVALMVRRTTIEEIGLDGFRDDDRFVEDLGID